MRQEPSRQEFGRQEREVPADLPDDEFSAPPVHEPEGRDEPIEQDLPAAFDEADEEQLFEPAEGPEGQRPTEGERPFGEGSGRRRRRRRGRDRDRGFERPDRPEQERGERPDRIPPRPQPVPALAPAAERGPRPTEGEPKPAWTPPAPGTMPRSATGAQRIALFLDVEGMLREARGLGGQVAFSRALRQIAGARTVVRAIAYCTPQSRGTGGAAGLETIRVDHEVETPVAIAVDALATAGRVDCVVIAPESAATSPLVRALRAYGVRVESAGFEARGRSEVADHQRLGKDALFAP